MEQNRAEKNTIGSGEWWPLEVLTSLLFPLYFPVYEYENVNLNLH